MKGIFSLELARAFNIRRFAAILVLALGSVLAGIGRVSFLTGPQTIHPVNAWLLIQFYTPFTLLAALFATLPFADSLLEDRQQGFLLPILLRTPYRRYLGAKVLATALSGAAALLLAQAVHFLVVQLFIHGDAAARTFTLLSTSNPSEPRGPLGSLYAVSPWGYLGVMIVVAMVFGACYSLLGLGISTLIHNRIITLLGPLVLFQALSFLQVRTRSIPAVLNPEIALYPNAAAAEAVTGWIFPLQYGLVLLIALALLFIFARRKSILA